MRPYRATDRLLESTSSRKTYDGNQYCAANLIERYLLKISTEPRPVMMLWVSLFKTHAIFHKTREFWALPWPPVGPTPKWVAAVVSRAPIQTLALGGSGTTNKWTANPASWRADGSVHGRVAVVFGEPY